MSIYDAAEKKRSAAGKFRVKLEPHWALLCSIDRWRVGSQGARPATNSGMCTQSLYACKCINATIKEAAHAEQDSGIKILPSFSSISMDYMIV